MKKYYELKEHIFLFWCVPYISNDGSGDSFVVNEGDIAGFVYKGEKHVIDVEDKEKVKNDVALLNEMLGGTEEKPEVIVEGNVYFTAGLTGSHRFENYHVAYCNDCPLRETCIYMIPQCCSNCDECEFLNEEDGTCRAKEEQ